MRNVTLTALCGEQKAVYNLPPKYSKLGFFPTSIVANNLAKVVAANYVGRLGIGMWDTETAHSIAQAIYPVDKIFWSSQLALDPYTNTYLSLTDQGVWRYNSQDNSFTCVIPDAAVSICLVDRTMLMLGDENGAVHWFDTGSFKKIGSLKLDRSTSERRSINAIKKLSDTTFLAAASNGFIYQLRKSH